MARMNNIWLNALVEVVDTVLDGWLHIQPDGQGDNHYCIFCMSDNAPPPHELADPYEERHFMDCPVLTAQDALNDSLFMRDK